jgi:hypothetical protein
VQLAWSFAPAAAGGGGGGLRSVADLAAQKVYDLVQLERAGGRALAGGAEPRAEGRRGARGVAVVQTTEPPLERVTDVTESERMGVAEYVAQPSDGHIMCARCRVEQQRQLGWLCPECEAFALCADHKGGPFIRWHNRDKHRRPQFQNSGSALLELGP